MELLFYFICGVLYALLAMFAILFVIAGIYGVIKIAFWIFETLDIKNPFCVIHDYFMRDK